MRSCYAVAFILYNVCINKHQGYELLDALEARILMVFEPTRFVMEKQNLLTCYSFCVHNNLPRRLGRN